MSPRSLRVSGIFTTSRTRPGRVREIVQLPVPRAERGGKNVRGQMQSLQDELWSLIRSEAIDAEREVQHA